MTTLILLIFAVTYLGMALGRIPGLRTDRSGIALVAAVLMIALTGTGIGRAVGWLDLSTLAVLFGLMVLSAQFAISGFYDYCADRISHAAGSPARLLAITILVCAGLSAVLANDIIAFAVPPLLCLGLQARRLNPVPFLIALAAATNVGSAATVIGNPQNILIGQVGQLDFWRFIAISGVPSLLGLAVIHLVISRQWRDRWELIPTSVQASPAAALRRGPFIKAVVATLVLLAAFGTSQPRDLAALLIAAALFTSRRTESRALVGAVDWNLLILFGGLFVVTGMVAELPQAQALFQALLDADLLPDRLSILAPLTLVMSNTIGNVPSVILLLQVWPAPPAEALYALALLATLAGNLLLTGSLANLIVSERAASVGVSLPFLAHARAGIPITLITMAIACLWLLLIGVLPI